MPTLENLRETNTLAMQSFARPTPWVIFLAALLICVFSGPFGTFSSLSCSFRSLYWGLIVLGSGAMAVWAHALVSGQGWRSVSRLATVSAVYGGLTALLVIGVSLLLLTPIGQYPTHATLIYYSFPSAAVSFFLCRLLMHQHAATPDAADRPALFDRLQTHTKAQAILSLTAKNHYVEVTTDLGSELCLIRLRDAITEVHGLEGFQIHRSHWVAESAVAQIVRQDGSVSVELTNGDSLPISQSRLAEFEAFLQAARSAT